MSTNQTHTTDKNIFVYGLFDPVTDELRYIGKTSRGECRIKEHFFKSVWGTKKTHKEKWIAKHVEAGLEPHHAILSYCVDEEADNAKEIELIAHYREQGFNLTNSTVGGEGVIGHTFSEASKMQMSESAKKHRKDPTYRAKLSKKMTGMKRDPEACKQMGDTLRGRPRTQKHLDSIKKFHDARDASKHYVPTYNPYNMTQDWANQIRSEYIPYKNGRYALAKKHGVGTMTIRNILNGRTWNK